MFVRIHIVQKGETLWRIAKHYGIGLDELKRLNAHLANPDYIVPGMEIVLPETANAPENPGSKAGMTKEQQTAPITSKAVETAPKEIMTKEQPKPVKEIPKVVETAPMPKPMPEPVPMPQLDLTPQFHFDFAPQMHFQQPHAVPAPQPQPMPMPQPQPIFIEMPQPMPMPQPQVQQVQQVVEKEVEKEVEYVPIPQPHIVYVPYIPHPQPQYHHPMPCGCKEQHFHHPKPCGCKEQPIYHHPSPCGCYEPQHMSYDCGCQGGYAPQQVMSYNMPYFEPNYDISPVMDTNYPEDEGLPDWLVDSSSMSSNQNEDLAQYVMSEQYEDDTDDKDCDKDTNVAGVSDYNQDMYNYDHGVQPSHAYYGNYDMQQVMPQQVMPYMMPQQQFMYPNCHKPYMNPYSSHYTPWNY